VKLGLHIPDFSYDGGPKTLARDLTRIASAAEDAGFQMLSVMDHVWQIQVVGPPELDMLEAYTTLGYLAARTERIRLLAWVTAVVYREPGLLAKSVSTLDVLSEGRAWLGIGAAWNVEEARSLGIRFPDLPDRFRLLDDTLKMAHQAWRGERDSGPFNGRVVKAERVMLSPQQLSKPRIPILVGGGGERTTLRLVARYADACNVFGAPDMLRHKYDVLRRHCEAVGRDYDSIEKTNLSTVSITPDGSRGSLTPSALLERLGNWADAGSHQTIFSIRGVSDISKIELIGRDVIPHLAGVGSKSPLDA
jgi:F420-dependent oxidoreductase-like protein